MKFKISFFTLMLIANVSMAQNTFPTSGFVGINTTSPQSPLEIYLNEGSKPGGVTAATMTGLRISRYGTPFGSYNEVADFRLGHGGPAFWGSKLELYVNGGVNESGIPDQLAMTWQYDGKVGIGTNNPTYRLTVGDGDVKAFNYDGFSGVSMGAEYSQRPRIGFHVSDDSRRFKIEVNSINTNDERLGIFSTGGGAFSETEMFNVNKNGNVGIGTSTPDAKLAVKGEVHAQKVKVDMTGWSDYVFSTDYHLPSLTTVKAYIDKNKHLPDLPSEAEILKNGIDMGAMFSLQTKKIEELTLYLIELKKENDQLKQTNKELAGKVDVILEKLKK